MLISLTVTLYPTDADIMQDVRPWNWKSKDLRDKEVLKRK